MLLLLIFALLFSGHINANKNTGPAATQTNTSSQSNTSKKGQGSSPMPQPQSQPQPQETQSQAQQPVIIINNYQNNDAQQTQANANLNKNNQSNNNSNDNTNSHTTSFMNQIKQSILKFLTFAKKEVPKQQEVVGFFQKNQSMILLCALGSTYGLLFAYMYTLSNFLADKESWHSWKRELSVQDLAMGDVHELTHNLCIAIQQKYFNPQNATNYMKPFGRFYKDIIIEMEKIDRYTQIGNIINTCQATFLFPVTKKRIKRAIEKRKRLEFIQKLIVTHMATQNSMPMTRSYTFDVFMRKYLELKRINYALMLKV